MRDDARHRFTPPPALRARLAAMYAEPHRRYHTLAHIDALCRHLTRWRALAMDAHSIDAAIWFHDAIYDTRRSDNDAPRDDADAWLFLDLDLSVLAQRADRYDAYARAIRAEYDWVPDARYAQGRANVLERFAQRDAIYHTPALHMAWEQRARCNLAAELSALAARSDNAATAPMASTREDSR